MSAIDWQGTVTIKAPVEQVYRYLADFPRHAEWAQSVVELKEIHPGDQRGIGKRYRTAERQGWQADRRPKAAITRGVPGDTICEVVELVPNRRIAWSSWAPFPVVKHAGEFAFELASDGDGGTQLTQHATLRDNWLGVLVSTLVFKTTPEKAKAQWAASLRNIKEVLESA